MLCCTKRGTELFSRSHSSASGQPNTWSGGEARQHCLGPGPPAPRSPGPSGTFDVALFPQRLQRGPSQQELAQLLPDLADVTLQACGPRGGRRCPTPTGTRGLGQSLAPRLVGRSPKGCLPSASTRLTPTQAHLHQAVAHPPASFLGAHWTQSPRRCSHFPPREAGLRTRITQSQRGRVWGQLAAVGGGESFWDGVRD